MIRVDFKDGTSKDCRIGSVRLGQKKWHYVEYRPSFQKIADILKVDVETIDSWRVI